MRSGVPKKPGSVIALPGGSRSQESAQERRTKKARAAAASSRLPERKGSYSERAPVVVLKPRIAVTMPSTPPQAARSHFQSAPDFDFRHCRWRPENQCIQRRPRDDPYAEPSGRPAPPFAVLIVHPPARESVEDGVRRAEQPEQQRKSETDEISHIANRVGEELRRDPPGKKPVNAPVSSTVTSVVPARSRSSTESGRGLALLPRSRYAAKQAAAKQPAAERTPTTSWVNASPHGEDMSGPASSLVLRNPVHQAKKKNAAANIGANQPARKRRCDQRELPKLGRSMAA